MKTNTICFPHDAFSAHTALSSCIFSFPAVGLIENFPLYISGVNKQNGIGGLDEQKEPATVANWLNAYCVLVSMRMNILRLRMDLFNRIGDPEDATRMKEEIEELTKDAKRLMKPLFTRPSPYGHNTHSVFAALHKDLDATSGTRNTGGLAFIEGFMLNTFGKKFPGFLVRIGNQGRGGGDLRVSSENCPSGIGYRSQTDIKCNWVETAPFGGSNDAGGSRGLFRYV